MELNTITGGTYTAGNIIPVETQKIQIEQGSDAGRTRGIEKDLLHEKAQKDAEFVKRFLYMLAGIPYQSPEKIPVSHDGSRWA
jgi:hypothetical protein